MAILICFRKISVFILLLFFLFNGCNEVVAPDLNNKNDPNAVSFNGESPSNLKLTILSENAIKLEWIDNSDYEDGYTIERSINNENKFVEIGKVGSNATSFIDSNAVVYNSYIYRLRMSNIKTKITSVINFEPYSEKILLSNDVDDFSLSPNGEYIAIVRNQIIKVINILDGREIFSCSLTGSFTISNNFLAVTSPYSYNKTTINVWRINDGNLYTSFITAGQVEGMAFNHNEDILAIGAFVTLTIWNIGVIPSVVVKEYQDLSGFSYLEFNSNDKYLMAVEPSTISGFTIYSALSLQILYRKEIPNNIFPHFISNDVVFFRDNSFYFYNLEEGKSITIEDTLNYGYMAFAESRVNINNSGSILSAYNSSNRNKWLLTDYVVKIDLWSLNNSSLIKKIKAIDLGNELPKKNAFSSINDFIVLTNSDNLYLWKYY